MTIVLTDNPADGGPGIEPRWTRSNKDGVGTAYSALSRVWFTVSRGMMNEIYYPTVDRPQIRDLQFLISDGETFFKDERHLDNVHECLNSSALGYRITNTDSENHYRLVKEVISAPHQDCLLIHAKLEADAAVLPKLRLYALLAPHLEGGGAHNTANVVRTEWGELLTAHRGGTWVVMAASIPFRRCSCGFVGVNDGWQDLANNYQMDWNFNCALDGNVALTGEMDIRRTQEFVLALAFGNSLHHALVMLSQTLAVPFAEHRARFIEQWSRACTHLVPHNEAMAGDGGQLHHVSHSLILAHEDKFNDGAMIASLSIPWGEYAGDDDLGGYHLVWTRDMCQSATGLLAAGNVAVPLRALIYLACAQLEDGGFYQNFWIDGEPYWRGIQLDETAFPITLAWRLHRAKALQDFHPWPLVRQAAAYLLIHGPATPQERWEENSGYSPSTLAAHMAGLICAACFARERGELDIAQHLEEYADFLDSHLEQWTVTTEGTLVPGIRRHYIRIHPVNIDDPHADENPNYGQIELKNQPPGARTTYPAKEIVDAGFLELVRHGIRPAGDPLIEDSLRVVDAVLKVDTPFGPCWKRYNHDGFGQNADGGPFVGWGQGQGWPLLTGERGHYELAAGRDVKPYLRAMEAFATSVKLLPEQVWANADLPEAHMFLGQPTGGAMPLLWAHAEYIKLLRSATDGKVFDVIPEVADHFRKVRPARNLEIWRFNRQPRSMRADGLLRIQANAKFQLRWSLDEWRNVEDTLSKSPGLAGVEYADVQIPPDQKSPLRFTFFWLEAEHWEGRNFEIAIQ